MVMDYVRSRKVMGYKDLGGRLVQWLNLHLVFSPFSLYSSPFALFVPRLPFVLH